MPVSTETTSSARTGRRKTKLGNDSHALRTELRKEEIVKGIAVLTGESAL